VQDGKPNPKPPLSDARALYYEKLHTNFESITETLEDQVSQLTDSLHSFTLLAVKLPLKDSAEIWNRDLKAYAPTFLLNHHNKFSAWPHFQRFFTSTVNQTMDDLIHDFTDPAVLKELPIRVRYQILDAFRQFTLSLKYRLTALISEFNPELRPDIQNTFLLKPNQNPVTFLNWMASLFLDASSSTTKNAPC
jgi:hypothetical protein